jgi:hypothetical protein
MYDDLRRGVRDHLTHANRVQPVHDDRFRAHRTEFLELAATAGGRGDPMAAIDQCGHQTSSNCTRRTCYQDIHCLFLAILEEGSDEY